MPLDHPYIIVGLGNPGPEYDDTRHNVGWMVVDRLAVGCRTELKLRRGGFLAEAEIDSRIVHLIKPTTYVNLSGQAVATLARKLDVPTAAIIVVHDDLDLELADLRIKAGGGSGGHRGVDSIIASLGADDFPRVRVGIGRPPGRMAPADFVLKRFRKNEWPQMDVTITKAVQAATAIVTSGAQAAMNEFNRS